MTLTLIPDIEKVVSDALRVHPDLVSLNVRVVGKTPTQTDTSPWVKVTQITSPQVNQPDHLVEFMVQFDCYATTAGGQPQANILVRRVRAILGEVVPGAHGTDGTITGVKILGGSRVPDTDFEPARERVILTALIYAHAS